MLFILLNIMNPTRESEPSDQKEQVEAIENMNRVRQLRHLQFTPDRFFEYMVLTGIHKADLVFKQSVLETGGFTSDIFIENHNLFGMKMPHTRITTATGENRGHAMYKHWTDSVEDYALWQDFYLDSGYDFSDYYAFLRDVNYAEDPKYNQKLNAL